LLLTRIFFITFLVLGFAQPFLSFTEFDNSENRIVVYTENSFSLSNEIEIGKIGIEEENNITNAIIKKHPKSTEILHLTNDFLANQRYFKNREHFLNEPVDVAVSSKNPSFKQIIEEIDRRSNPQAFTGNSVFIISDFQKSTMKDLRLAEPDSSTNYYLIPINQSNSSNIFVDSVFLENYYPFSESNRMQIRLRNSGSSNKDFTLNVLLNDEIYSSNSLNMQGNSSRTIGIDLIFQQANMKGEIRIEENPVVFDNTFYFSLNSNRQHKVVELTDEPGENSITKVFGNGELFSFSQLNTNNFNESSLEDSDLVIINSPNKNYPVFEELMIKSGTNGFNILIIPNPDYPEIIEDLNLGMAGQVVKGDFQDVHIENINNELFENIFESDINIANVDMPVSGPLLLFPENAEKILTNQKGEGFFTKTRGTNIYSINVPLSSDFTNFHRHALFLPIMYKLSFNRTVGNTKLYYPITDTPFAVNADTAINSGLRYYLAKDDIEIIPNQWVVDGKLFLEVSGELTLPGNYDLRTGNTNLGNISLNLGKEESILETYSGEELQLFADSFENVTVLDPGSGNTVLTAGESQFDNIYFWRYALILALVFLFVEIIIIRFL
jgi:hypothetical protein